MLERINPKSIEIVQNMDQAIGIMRDAGRWLEESGKKPSKWWQLQNLNPEFLLLYAKPAEFFVALTDGKPAAAAILQFSQEAQDWQGVDKSQPEPALYIHWLCVSRQFAGKGLPGMMVDFAKKHAEKKGVNLLRVDTSAEEVKLRKIYEDLGFKLVGIAEEDYRQTAFYQQG